MYKICVVGVGYIGLPTALVFANAGYEVVGCDVDTKKIKALNCGDADINESELTPLLKRCLKSGNLTFSAEPILANVFIICVPSPIVINNGIITQNTSYIFSAIDKIAPFAKDGSYIIIETTSEVGITEKVRDYYNSKSEYSNKINFAYCAERIIPGDLIKELYSNDRVLGIDNPAKAQELSNIYQKALPDVQIDVLSTRAAEAVKLIENSYRDVNIAYANSVYNLCLELDIEPIETIKVANKHPRVNILQPGFGVGGHCIPIDPWFLISGREQTAKLLLAARQVNDEISNLYVERMIHFCKNNIEKDKTTLEVLFLGCTYKPNVDDLRESPAIKIINQASRLFKKVYVVEPLVEFHKLKKQYQNIEFLEINALCKNKKIDVVSPLVWHSKFDNHSKDIIEFYDIIYDPLKMITKLKRE